MSTLRSIAVMLASAAASASVFAQSGATGAADNNYLGVQIGTGKVSLNCPANSTCSRVDSSSVVRLGHRFDPAWAAELTYSHIDADFNVFSSDYSAAYTGIGVGAAYRLSMSDSVQVIGRLGASANALKLQPAVAIGGKNPGTLSTRSVKPYLGVALSWQFARHWSTSLNLDWTRGNVRDAATAPKQSVTVRTAGVGVAFNF